MFSGLLAFILALLLPLGGSIEQRLLAWPDWSLPAPLTRPGQTDLEYPQWFEGVWLLDSNEISQANVVFRRRDDGKVVGLRAANAAAVAKQVLADEVLAVEDDPINPNRQLTKLSNDRLLETSIQGRATETSKTGFFLADELSIQTLRQPGLPPRVSRIEILSKFHLISEDHIEVEQWQARYPSPEQGLRARPITSSYSSLQLERQSGNGNAKTTGPP
jgi:hypothetical protein